MASVDEKTGPYRHLKLIYSGEATQLFKARDERNGRLVALKRLRGGSDKGRNVTEQMRREVQMTSLLPEKKFFIEIFEMGKEGGIPYLVMEWFPAPNVGQLINLGYENYAPVLPALIPLLFEPLVPLHDAGVVHRDIKPDNFLYSPDLGLKLIDFAIACKKGEGRLTRLFIKSTKTQGTATYMSPEQIENKSLDNRSDLYSLGCSILELLTASAPFSGNSLGELLQKHLKGPVPSAIARNKNVSPAFDSFLKSLLARDPADRPGSAREALAILKRTPIFVRPPKSGDKLP